MDVSELYITAELAGIELSQDEVPRLQNAVTQMVEYFSKMTEMDVEDLEPTTHALLAKNRLRPDSVRPENVSDELLENAPELEDRFIVIPNVL